MEIIFFNLLSLFFYLTSLLILENLKLLKVSNVLNELCGNHHFQVTFGS
jgi:hypothetical protein